jgi:hypothetical protein
VDIPYTGAIEGSKQSLRAYGTITTPGRSQRHSSMSIKNGRGISSGESAMPKVHPDSIKDGVKTQKGKQTAFIPNSVLLKSISPKNI